MIEKREKRKKIFYVPGMISLVLIPLFCFYHFYKVDAFKVYGSLDVSFPTDQKMIEPLFSFKRNYRIFDFNSSLDLEEKKINKLQFALRKLNKENDLVNGIKIHLGKKAKYEVYIRILDIIQIEGIMHYVQYKNDIFVLMIPKPKVKAYPEVNMIMCGSGYLAGDVDQEYILEQERKAKLQRIIMLLKKNWILYAGYFGLAVLNIQALRKFNKNKKYNQK